MADLDIPVPAAGPAIAPSYRMPRARKGLDVGTKRLLIAAGGLGTLLLLLAGGWAVSHRRPGVVPVIEADSRPIRVKPEHAGGMQVVGADEQVMGDGGTATALNLAPPPEVPAASALRAQVAPTLPPETAGQAPVPVAAVPQPALGTIPPQVRDAAQRPPGAQALAARPGNVPSIAAATTGAAAAGSVQVQLAALESEQSANGEWQRLSRQMPDLLGQRRPSVQRAERDGKAVWRLRTGGFADIADATTFCARVRAKGASCTIASF